MANRGAELELVRENSAKWWGCSNGRLNIVAVNEYVGWYIGRPPDRATARWEIPYDKPVFVSEFGGDARQAFHGDKTQRWAEEFQE